MNPTESKPSLLEQLRAVSTIVADTGDFEAMKKYRPQDATTNPSLILKAANQPEYVPLVERVVHDLKSGEPGNETLVDSIVDGVLVAFGKEILQIVPGRVSTEVDARLSFDTQSTVRKARSLIALYEAQGVSRDRVLIKIASTWEGIRAAELLQTEGINCNLTLMFSMTQAIACAKAKVKLISPFVGRIYDWYKAATGREYSGPEDPGVQSVVEIYNCYKRFGYDTEIMGASFRNCGQIVELAGCDLLTISPNLLEELSGQHSVLERKLTPDSATGADAGPEDFDEQQFRYSLNDDAMATEKTAEGIRKFSADMNELEELVRRALRN